MDTGAAIGVGHTRSPNRRTVCQLLALFAENHSRTARRQVPRFQDFACFDLPRPKKIQAQPWSEINKPFAGGGKSTGCSAAAPHKSRIGSNGPFDPPRPWFGARRRKLRASFLQIGALTYFSSSHHWPHAASTTVWLGVEVRWAAITKAAADRVSKQAITTRHAVLFLPERPTTRTLP
jgi:hypothetical protein